MIKIYSEWHRIICMLTNLTSEFDKALGLVAFKEGDIDAGIEHFERYLAALQEKIEQNSDNQIYIDEKIRVQCKLKDILVKVAPSLYAEKKWRMCAKCCQYLIKYDTSDNSVYKHASFCFRELEQYELALELMQSYEKREPKDPLLDIYLGEAYSSVDKKKYADIALQHFLKALEKRPNDSQLYNIIGNLYASVIDFEGTNFDRQFYYFSEGLKHDPDDRHLLRNLHLTYLKRGDIENAKRLYERLYKLHGKNFDHDACYDYAAFQVYIGNFKTGWAYMDHRFQKENGATYYPEIPAKLWNGSINIQKDTLLVHCEQGFGDVIMYVRFVEQMKRYAKNVIFRVQNELFELFKESRLPFPVFPLSVPLEELQFDYHIPLVSIPRVIKLTPETITPKGKYLNINPQRVEVFKNEFLNTHKFKIGVCFEGNASAKSEQRDIDWKYLSFLSQNPNVQLYCLKKGCDEEFFKKIDPNINIKCFGHVLRTFADTATAIKGLDLVVSTDNVILNLSGALGVPTLGLYNKSREYRWYGTEEGRCIWYDSVKPMQAIVHNDWGELMQRVAIEVDKIVEQHMAR